MYQHLLFNHDDYYFNREWAMKYMENYGWGKDRVAKVAKAAGAYINDDKLMKKDCPLIVKRMSPLMDIDCVCLLVKNYQTHYIDLAETNPAMVKYYNPAIWWEKFRKGLVQKFDEDLEY